MKRLMPILAAASMFLAACSPQDEAVDSTPKDTTYAVKLMQVDAHSAPLSREFAGRVRAVKTVDLSFQVSGKLEQLAVKEGEFVPEGHLLARLEQQDYRRAVREAEVQLDLSRKTLRRQEELAERDAISDQVLDESRSSYDLAEVALDQARQNLEYTELVAPFDALVTQRLIENFSNVSAGQGVLRLQDMSEIRIEIAVPESLFATVQANQIRQLTAEFDFLPGRIFAVQVREYQTEADPVTQTYQVEVGMPRPDDLQILPGMNARVKAELQAMSAAHSLPLTALQKDAQGQFFVWVVEDGKVQRRNVQTGPLTQKQIKILSGLQGGETVVAAGGTELFDGARVQDYRQQL